VDPECQSFTAKAAEDAKKRKSLTAKDTKDANGRIFGTLEVAKATPRSFLNGAVKLT
jgi:hypothetical protein